MVCPLSKSPVKDSLVLLLSVLFLAQNISGQQSIVLSFSSLSTLDSVKIENLSSGSFQVITGNSIEILMDSPSRLEPDLVAGETRYYPNPFNYYTNIELPAGESQTVSISVFDITGSLVAKLNHPVEAGVNQFVFRPGHPGIYFLNASNGSGLNTLKLLCMEAGTNPASIEFNGAITSRSPDSDHLKSGLPGDPEDFSAVPGDLLKFTGYSGKRTDTKYDFLNTDKNYEFRFLDKYFRFNDFAFQANAPGSVTMLFSVSDSAHEGVDYLTGDDFIVSEDSVVKSPASIFLNLKKSEEIPSLLRTVLLLDNSLKIGPNLNSVRAAALRFAESMVENQETALYVYSDSAVLMRDFTNREIILDYWIKKIRVDSNASDLSNSLEKPLNKSRGQYTFSHLVQGSLIILSGGMDSPEGFNPGEEISGQNNTKVYAISLDGDTDSIPLSRIAYPGQYYSVRDIDELDKVFESIQTDIVRSSNSFYCLNYMSGSREGEHNVTLSVADNRNSDSTAFLSHSFNADGFASAAEGVYLNPNDSAIYGLDTIRCFARRPNYIFASDTGGNNPYAIDTLVLEPVTYGGTKTPEYTWELSHGNSFKIESLPLINAVLIPLSMARDTVTIILRDLANNFSKNIVFIMDPPEFYENMGIILSAIKDSRLREISGIAASVKYPGYFWVHNDSGDDAYVYLIDLKGNTIARVLIREITSRDWEDIAVGPGPEEGTSYIYIGDIGDLEKEYTFKYIYRLAEPEVDTTSINQDLTVSRNGVSAFTYNYADGSRDAEILMIDPSSRDLFIVTKREEHVQIYTLPYPQSDTDTLILTKSDVTLPFRMTNGGDISADGNEILIKNLTTVYYWKRDAGETIIGTLSRRAMSLPYIKEPQGEAIGWFRDGSGYITVSEKKDNITPLLYLYKR